MKLIIIALISYCLPKFVIGQVDKQIIVEHFTNTVCSICASKNPNLNSNLQNNPDIIRISYHPSSPYSNCAFSQHNVSGNDGRTNQYGIYGGTPRIVINGNIESASVDFGDPNLFDAYKNQTSPFLLNTFIDSITQDSVYVSVEVVCFDGTSFTQTPYLYVGLAEDTIAYNAPNGENEHYGVFRKELATSMVLSLAQGDSTHISFAAKIHPNWNINRIFGYSIINTSPGYLVSQASTSQTVQTAFLNIEEEEGDEGFDVHFNSVSNQLSILKESCNSFSKYEIYSLEGKIVRNGYVEGYLTYVNLSYLSKGVYLIRLSSNGHLSYSKAIKFVK